MNFEHTTAHNPRILLQKAFNVTFKLQTTSRTSPRIVGSPLLPIPQERPSTRTSHPRGPRGEARAAAEFQFQGIRPVKHPHPFWSTQQSPEKGKKDPFSAAQLFKDFFFDDPQCTFSSTHSRHQSVYRCGGGACCAVHGGRHATTIYGCFCGCVSCHRRCRRRRRRCCCCCCGGGATLSAFLSAEWRTCPRT